MTDTEKTELNAAVAREVMGYTLCTIHVGLCDLEYWDGGDYQPFTIDFNPLDSWADAGRVVDRLTDVIYGPPSPLTLCGGTDTKGHAWFCEIGPYDHDGTPAIECYAPTPHEAIVRAALAAVRAQKEKRGRGLWPEHVLQHTRGRTSGRKGGGMNGYYFTSDTLRNGEPIPPVGEWLVHDGDVVPCRSGLHASAHPFDALWYAPGNFLHRVELEGDLQSHGDPVDKWVGRRRRIVATIDAGPLLREFARWCALQVIDLWDAPAVVREYLEAGAEENREAAREAAWSAAREAAGSAAWSAAREAARAAARAAAGAAAGEAAREAAWAATSAAREAQRQHFAAMVNRAFTAAEAAEREGE